MILHSCVKVLVCRCNRIVVSSKSNEFKNKIEIIQSAFEKNMVSIENQFMAKIGSFEMFRLVSKAFSVNLSLSSLADFSH